MTSGIKTRKRFCWRCTFLDECRGKQGALWVRGCEKMWEWGLWLINSSEGKEIEYLTNNGPIVEIRITNWTSISMNKRINHFFLISYYADEWQLLHQSTLDILPKNISDLNLKSVDTSTTKKANSNPPQYNLLPKHKPTPPRPNQYQKQKSLSQRILSPFSNQNLILANEEVLHIRFSPKVSPRWMMLQSGAFPISTPICSSGCRAFSTHGLIIASKFYSALGALVLPLGTCVNVNCNKIAWRSWWWCFRFRLYFLLDVDHFLLIAWQS